MRVTLRNCSALSAAKDICSAPETQTGMSSPLRTRLTIWYVGAFSVVLILFSGGVYFFVKRILRERIDTNLLSTLQATGLALASRGSEISVSSVQLLDGQPGRSPLAESFEEPHFP